jgi:hypothetical protein
MDMDSLRRENDKTVAVGNMKVNARGDQIDRGQITKTADQIARENHRVQSAVVNTGLKGKQPVAPSPVIEPSKKSNLAVEDKKVVPKTKEVELPSGDIVIEEDKNE